VRLPEPTRLADALASGRTVAARARLAEERLL
jgi:hypothetical protein